MKYNDGIPMDEELRATVCPKCGNDEISKGASFCMICGMTLFNLCEGEEVYDNHGNVVDRVIHSNRGNARFCEKCGKPTAFFQAKYLRPYSEVKDNYTDPYIQGQPNAFSVEQGQIADDELPF